MRSRDKFSTGTVPIKDKLWVKVFFTEAITSWTPSFEDLFRVIRLICYCEDEKYPHGKGRFKVREFLRDCCELLKPGQTAEDRWLELAAKYDIPLRE